MDIMGRACKSKENIQLNDPNKGTASYEGLIVQV